MRYYTNYLKHHGIKGQKWGIRRFQNYDGTRIKRYDSKDSTTAPTKKGLSDKQKTALKVGATVIGTALVAYGGYKLVTNPKVKAKVNDIINGNKEKRMADLEKEISNAGPEISRKKSDWGYDTGEDIKSAGKGSADLPEEVMKMAVNKNPFGRKDNCKEVAHAFCESMYSNDPKVIAGKKPRFKGNLYDYVTEKLGIPEKHVIRASGSNGEELRNKTIERINNRFEDGDYGMIGFDGNPEKINRLRKAGLLDDVEGIDGHCFNWIKQNGEVKFFDCAPEGGPIDASGYFDRADFSKDAEFICYNKAKSAQ